MKSLEIPFLKLKDGSLDSISAELDKLTGDVIGEVNWSDYPYKPDVNFKMGYDEDNLYLKFRVHEKAVRALNTEPNSLVWEDSCCEFFCDFDGKGYYNLETNCIGTQLLGYGEQMEDRELAAKSRTRADVDIISKIEKKSTLGSEPFDVKTGDFRYEIVMKIPAVAFYRHNIRFSKGQQFRANFYKCGDETPEVHFLSWNPINTETPNFHVPEFFGEIKLI
ncbi:MAG: hypothetical protein GXO47_05805 [Chlorobi bacterium]|nr:hypothetical protein [Chlorobiota bacterium]